MVKYTETNIIGKCYHLLTFKGPKRKILLMKPRKLGQQRRGFWTGNMKEGTCPAVKEQEKNPLP